MEPLLAYLLPSKVDEDELRNTVIPHLVQKGFRKVGDLEDLEKSDLEEFSNLTSRRIWKVVHNESYDRVAFSIDQSDQHEQEVTSIYIRYILCKAEKLFVDDIEQTDITDLFPFKKKLADLVEHIRSENGIPSEQEIEMYSSEGYPLQNNSITNKGSLASWCISDGDLFYVMLRPKNQPGIEKFVTLPELDHDVGTETFTIETPFSGGFPINAYMDCDSPEDIAQKVYSITDISVPFLSLFVRRGYTYERLSAFTELKDKDIIRVVLRNPQEIVQPTTVHYGTRSYNMLVQQTKSGLLKFYSILKFLCSKQPYNKGYDFEKLLSYLMTFTNFPPLIHALRCLKEHSFLSIPGWTALIEGCYCLIKAVLDSFANVNEKCVFEYSDYVWSILIKNSQNIENLSNIESELCSLACPLSGIKICNPVYIEGHEDLQAFDKNNVLSKIDEGGDFSEFGLQGNVALKHIKDDANMKRLLMYYPWETDRKVCVLLNKPKEEFPMVCKKVQILFTWFDMLNSLSELCIVNPTGLFSGEECLTYNEKSQLVYFMGSAKGTDEQRRIYNPCCNHEEYLQLVSKTDLQRIGSLNAGENVSCDLAKVLTHSNLNPSEISQSCSIKASAIITPQNSISWEPDEVIVVLLDVSGSMSDVVFPEMPGLKRIDAAKELFNAFATRTQAYKLHNAIGLTLFNSSVTVKLNISKNLEDFEESLKNVSAGGGTSLTDAVINGVRQLQIYHNCPKRILCLTDGYNGSSTPYSRALNDARVYGITVDTVLLTWPEDNAEQKSLCHATGGVCVLPKTMQEALRYFEMDAMLSMKERAHKIVPQIDIKNFKNVYLYPYETEQSFTSTYVQSFHAVKTSNSKSYIDQHKNQVIASSKQRRIMKELTEFTHNPHENITVYPSEDCFDKWKVLLHAPELTAYEGGNFILSVEFPEKYPFVPPQIRFLTSIYHCNVSSSSGRICHAILGDSYTPSTSMRDILSCIYGLLMCPDMDSSLDSALADEYGYQRNREKDLNKVLDTNKYFRAADEYFRKARQNVRQHACSKTLDVLQQELSGH